MARSDGKQEKAAVFLHHASRLAHRPSVLPGEPARKGQRGSGRIKIPLRQAGLHKLGRGGVVISFHRCTRQMPCTVSAGPYRCQSCIGGTRSRQLERGDREQVNQLRDEVSSISNLQVSTLIGKSLHQPMPMFSGNGEQPGFQAATRDPPGDFPLVALRRYLLLAAFLFAAFLFAGFLSAIFTVIKKS